MKNKFRALYPGIHYVLLGLLLALVGGLPGILFSKDLSKILHNEYVGWYLVYWFIITAIYVLIVIYFRRKRIEKPVKKMCDAAKKVANGDFSVYLNPPKDSYKYIQDMYNDFNHMVEELGSTKTLKNDFLGNVSHEFKAPLAVIKSYSNALKTGSLTQEEQQKSLDIISESADNLSTLVTDILRLNNLSNQSILAEIKKVNVSRQIADAALLLEPYWDEKGIEVEADLDDSCEVFSDEEMLSIVWNNLINNAIKYGKENGKIWILSKPVDDGIIISISDNGIGMKEEVVNHIFDQFYQGDISHRQKGNGLGLSMVRKIIDKVHGTISVTSTYKKGSTFSIWLPKNIGDYNR
ncbi:Signal transduction histidine kinase [Apilactobacillus kunkeei]|uniref:HAMP domain-containing sensor histidine kinase n=1 Tax=Apilactobacillus kunkeei TaxID=148814 RepID=UPI0006CE7E6E|nr:HAMP domain-containing sensor histidine kinase [Apilactobacillus kunkeei]KPN82420.1 Signal transduction histidine kinase [Apilactobacillus kunkeei]